MELAIIAGLGALGWGLSAKGATPPPVEHTPKLLRRADQFPFDNDTEHRALLDADAQNARDHYTSQQPFVTSDKTAHVQNQRKMEMFTGTEDTWNHKREMPRVFAPADTKVAVNSGGAARSADPLYDPTELIDRNVFGSKMNNVLPFDQQRVGPGVGVDAHVPSADGLHSRFRVLPVDALNEHKINQLPPATTASSGVAQVTNGSRRYDAFVQSKPSLVEHTPNMGAAISASFNAPTWNPETVCKPTRSEGTCTQLHGFKTAPSGGIQTARSCETHVQRRSLPETPWLTSKLVVEAPKQTATCYVRNDKGTNRSECPSVHVVGAEGSRYGNYVDLGCGNVHKKQLGFDGFAGGAHATARGHTEDGIWNVRHTTREQSVPTIRGKAVVGAGDLRVCEPDRSGLRELSTCTSHAASYLKKHSVRSKVCMGRGRETQGRSTNGAHQGGLVADLDHAGAIKTRKCKKNAFDVPKAGFAPYAIQRAGTGRATSCKKVPSEDPRTDCLGLGLQAT